MYDGDKMIMFGHSCIAQAQTLADSCYLFSFVTGSPLSTILPGAGVVSEAAMEATSRTTKGGGDQTVLLILAQAFTHSPPRPQVQSFMHCLSVGASHPIRQ